MNWKYIDTSWIKRLFSVKKKANTIPKQEKPFSNGRYVASYEGRPERNNDSFIYPDPIDPYMNGGIDPYEHSVPDNVQFGGGDFGGSGASSDWGSSDSSSDSSSSDSSSSDSSSSDSGSSDGGSSDCGGSD